MWKTRWKQWKTRTYLGHNWRINDQKTDVFPFFYRKAFFPRILRSVIDGKFPGYFPILLAFLMVCWYNKKAVPEYLLAELFLKTKAG